MISKSNQNGNQPTRAGDASGDKRHTFITKHGKPLVPTAALRGAPVRNSDEQDLGILKDLMIETNRGQVAYAVLLFENDKSFALPFGELEIDPETMTVYANVRREVFEEGAGMQHDNNGNNLLS